VSGNAGRGGSDPVLALSESAQAAMIAAAARSHPNETGGILVGVEHAGHPWVTGVIEIMTGDRGRHHYKIPGGATQPAVHAARRADARVGYLGDWHSHPADVGPSSKDLATLALISVKSPRKPNPTLVVVRNTSAGRVLDVRRFVGVTPRVCEVRYLGDLPAPAVNDEAGVCVEGDDAGVSLPQDVDSTTLGGHRNADHGAAGIEGSGT
jgi:proteasome lid subunit RPN8/RPN11